jgi:hypothetical protein
LAPCLAERGNLAEENKPRTREQSASGHQPARPATVQPAANERGQQRANNNFAGPEQGKQAARHSEIFGQRLEKNAQRAGKMKSINELREKSDGNDVPAIKQPWAIVSRRIRSYTIQCLFTEAPQFLNSNIRESVKARAAELALAQKDQEMLRMGFKETELAAAAAAEVFRR